MPRAVVLVVVGVLWGVCIANAAGPNWFPFEVERVAESDRGIVCRSGNGHSTTPRISADGQWVVYTSEAANLVGNDASRASMGSWLDVFVYGMNSRSNQLVSLNHPGIAGGNGPSFDAAISANGRYVVFTSEAEDLVPTTLMR